MSIRDTLLEYKVAVFLIILGLLSFSLFFAFALGPAQPQDPPANNTPTITTNTTPTSQTPTIAPNTPPETPDVSPTVKKLRTAYENTIQSSFILQVETLHKNTSTNKRVTTEKTIYYKNNTSLYEIHKQFINNTSIGHTEYYYTQETGYIKQQSEVNPSEIENQNLTNNPVSRHFVLNQYLEDYRTVRSFKQVTPQRYKTTIPLPNNQPGNMTITVQLSNNTIKNATIIKRYTKSHTNQTITRKTIIQITYKQYKEPEFYWKPDDK